jgi:hypothetical protein
MRGKPAIAEAGSAGGPVDESVQVRIDQELRDFE